MSIDLMKLSLGFLGRLVWRSSSKFACKCQGINALSCLNRILSFLTSSKDLFLLQCLWLWTIRELFCKLEASLGSSIIGIFLLCQVAQFSFLTFNFYNMCCLLHMYKSENWTIDFLIHLIFRSLLKDLYLSAFS